MKKHKLVLLSAAVVAMTACSSINAEDKQAPTTASQNAEPNITGIWEIYPDPFEGEENLFAELQVPDGGPKLKEPYATQWKNQREKREAMLKAGTPLVDPSTLCQPEGMPAIMGAIFPLEFLQTPRQVTVLAEFLSQARRIYLDRPMKPLDELNPNYFGYSVGKWEGDTLVVTTQGIREDVEFFEIPHSANMVVTERITLTAPNLIENVITIDDPEMLQEPYQFTYGYKRNPDYEIQEYYCAKEDPLFKVTDDGTVEMKTGSELD